MFKLAIGGLVATMLAVVPTAGPTMASGPSTGGKAPQHTLTVSGTDIGMYPAYSRSVRRYAMTATDATFAATTGATVIVHATTSDPKGMVLVNGRPITGGQVAVPGLHPGDEISVIYVDSAGREADSAYVLPANFPTLTATVHKPGINPGLVAMTLSQWQANQWPQFDTVVDSHGVPAWVRTSTDGGLDLKRQPNGNYSESRPATPPTGRTGMEIVELDSDFNPIKSHRTVGLTNTDGHDSILEADGSQVLLAYEPNSTTGKTDAVIEESDADGNVTFRWDSSGVADETVAASGQADYAHINSVEIVDGGDNFLASFRHFSSVFKIARRDHDGYQKGEIVWKLGGRDSSFSFDDDPYGGPCAQHAAVQLPDDWGAPGEDVMMFDDGSVFGFGALCVDPSDPSGPTIDRPQSRAVIYHLDEGAHTATPVWSYGPTTPSPWFSWFMGSTQYLDQTGNVLVGWSAATQALATEVDADEQPVWELAAAPSSNGRTYISYRATKFDVPDTIDPEVEVAQPREGASYAFGAVAKSSFGCTDRGGSTLHTCGPQVSGRALDTSTPGAHTFRVRATDGAGNATTVLRHYQVAPPVYRQDVSVRRANGHWLGAGAYGPVSTQTVSRTIRRGGPALRQRFELTNRGTAADRCTVKGTPASARFPATYRATGRDVTKAVGRGWRTPSIERGKHLVVQLTVRPTKGTPHGAQRRFVVSCTSSHRPGWNDAAAVRVRMR